MTASEVRLWRALRGRQFQGWNFRRQHPVGPFVLDFYCDAVRLAIEIDGGVHTIDAVARHDAERQALLTELGIRFLRVSAEAVESDLRPVLATIGLALAESHP